MGDRVELEQQRTVDNTVSAARVGATSEERFAVRDPLKADAVAAPDPGESPFTWELPAGWLELAPTQMRLANLRPAGHPNAECTLSVMPGNAGGVLLNVNRWRDQMGLAPMVAADLDLLPVLPLFGRPGSLIDLRGVYTGMGTVGRPDWGMLALILSLEQFTIFVKMTGPEGLITAEHEHFISFCDSLGAVERGAAPKDQVADENEADFPAEDEVNGNSEAPLTFAMPEGWSDAPPKTMRTLNLIAGEGIQCYVILLAGTAGGLESNINRWRGEVGLDAIDADAIAALPKVNLLGEPCAVLEVTGNYQGMGTTEASEQMVLAVPLIRESGSAFVKMVGPKDAVAAERERFLAFVASLEEKS